jgi:MFS family permease
MVAYLTNKCNYWLHIEKEAVMENALPASAPIPGAGALLTGRRPAAGPPPRSASQRWRAFGFSALATGAAWMTASVTSLAFAFTGVSQRLVTRTSPKLVMIFGMALIGAAILWAAQAPAHGHFWPDLAGPFFIGGAGTAFAFIPVSIGALAGVTGRDAGVASGLLNTAQNLGGAIGVAVASSIAASRFHTLAHQGYPAAAALTSGFHWALWVCGLTGLAAIPAALVLHRR